MSTVTFKELSNEELIIIICLVTSIVLVVSLNEFSLIYVALAGAIGGLIGKIIVETMKNKKRGEIR